MSYGEPMRYAYLGATHSPDPSTQNGAVLIDPLDGKVLASGINEFPFGVQYKDERWERPGKYQWIEHAERNAIYSAARGGIRTDGLTMVCPWAACADCARAIVNAGIRTLVRHAAHNTPVAHWDALTDAGNVILQEGGVRVIDLTCSFPECKPVLWNGELWQP